MKIHPIPKTGFLESIIPVIPVVIVVMALVIGTFVALLCGINFGF